MTRPEPPELRRPALTEPAVLTVRIDLQHARPPIWRRLELRSDLTLAEVHQIIQTAFSWADAHLYRFALGGDPFDHRSQMFLCPFDVEEGEKAGLPVDEVRLDEALQEPGDQLEYVYDYGDDWHLVLKVEAVRPADQHTPRVLATGGRRAAPPEDCGGLTEPGELAGVLEDPAHFDLGELNQTLAVNEFTLVEMGLHPALVDVRERLQLTPVSGDLAARMPSIHTAPDLPEPGALRAALQPVVWFLERAGDGGIQ